MVHDVQGVRGAVYALRVAVTVRRGQRAGDQGVTAVLRWQTPTVRVHPIAPFFLYSAAEEVPFSPFPVAVA